MSFLSVNNLSVSYKRNPVLKDFSLEVKEGSIYALIGPSGCGKSTLLKTISGIVSYSSGSIMLKGIPINTGKHTLGYIPQQYGLLDWLTVLENMSIGRKIGKKVSERKSLIIEQLEMQGWLNRYPRELSGGQQQRTALARALLLEPDLLLMDEPFSSLDTFTAEKSRDLFLQVWKEQKVTTLLITHNLQEAVRMAKYIVFLSKQPANVMQVVDNPLFGSGVRAESSDFYHLEQELKTLIRKLWEDDL